MFFLNMQMEVLGWNEQAPFDRIMVTANAPEIPKKLVDQLVENGIMIVPIGDDYSPQVLKVIKRKIKILLKISFKSDLFR